jgi:hypothetical protein
VVVLEKRLQVFGATQARVDHDAALVEAHRDRHTLVVEQVELVDAERPVEPPPLPVEA